MCLRRLAPTPQHSVAGHQLQERPLSAVATTENRAAGMAWSAHRVEAEDVDTELFNPVDVGILGGSEDFGERTGGAANWSP